MIVRELTSYEYQDLIKTPFSVFDSVGFSQINATKVDSVHHLVFNDEKDRFGLTLGIKDGVAKAPYSAPYACFSKIGQNTKTSAYAQAVPALVDFAQAKGCKKIRVTLPPSIYDESHMAQLYNSFYVARFFIAGCDLNFQYNLAGFTDDYEMQIDPKARQKLRAGIRGGLSFEKTSDIVSAYAVIKANREHKNYPLWMTLENIVETSKVVPIDFFLARSEAGSAVAAAMVYTVSADTVLVVYWGNMPDTDSLKPMNFLAFHIFKHYAQEGKKLLDIGPSTEFSVPNIGLCDFKQSLGCGMSTKLTFEKEI